ncbi:MAG: tetratricopeptide repeat protein [Thermoanaerobaculum sp.]|nr:tetratricopeptide repeat protein [Thermoanaerobaculum sp.]MDW7966941.1 tetratricopeptide repeat protein [Thermoanaerobaculum sp.]
MKVPLAAVGLFAMACCLGCTTATKHRAALPPGLDPSDPLAATVLLREGETMLRDGRTEEALDRFQAAASLQPANPVVHNFLGLAYLAKGEPASAVDAFSRALSFAPAYTDARNNRGIAYRALGQLALAESDFLAALQDLTYANRSGVFFNLGALYLAQGKLEAAEENLRRAATATGPPEAYLLLGEVQERLGKVGAAEEAYRKGMQRAPERADLPLRLATLLLNLGRGTEARELLQKVVELAPGSPEASQARALLAH